MGVFHLQQKQALRRRGGSRARGQTGEVWQVAASCFDQRAHYVPHHMFKETAAADAIEQASFTSFQDRREDLTHFGLTLAITDVGGGKRAEIVLTFEDAGEGSHAFLVQWVGMMVH